MSEPNLTMKERWEKHGKAWRYVYLLECELERRKIRQAYLLSSFALNGVLILALVSVLWA